MYNAEIRQSQGSDQYCCCDQGSDTCRTNLNVFSTTECPSNKFCDTYFVVTFPDNQNFEPYPTMLLSDVFTDTSTATDVNHKFQFFLSGVPSESV